VKIAVSSLASFNNSESFPSGINFVSRNISSQYTVSSASSATIPSLAANSARERATGTQHDSSLQ
jgi:hypothetical protein